MRIQNYLRQVTASVTAMVLGVAGLGPLTNASTRHGSSNISVTGILNDTGDVTNSTNYGVQSDSNGPYYNGVGSVSSILNANESYDWFLDTRSSTRAVLIDLREPVPGSNAQQIFAYQSVPTYIHVQCWAAVGLIGSFPAIKLNQTVSCPMYVIFNYAGVIYRLGMCSTCTSFPQTNNALVTCTGVDDSNQCNAWTILPITQSDGKVRNIAQLQKQTKNGGYTTSLGDFYLSFNFNVTNP